MMTKYVMNVLCIIGEGDQPKKISEAITDENDEISFSKEIPEVDKYDIDKVSNSSEELNRVLDKLNKGLEKNNGLPMNEHMFRIFADQEKNDFVKKAEELLGRSIDKRLIYKEDGEGYALLRFWMDENTAKAAVQKLSQKYPSVNVAHYWAEAGLFSMFNRMEYENGMPVDILLNARGDKVFDEGVAAIWGVKLEEHGYVLNEDTDNYEPVKDRTMDDPKM